MQNICRQCPTVFQSYLLREMLNSFYIATVNETLLARHAQTSPRSPTRISLDTDKPDTSRLMMNRNRCREILHEHTLHCVSMEW
jgi:hypothetical protein